LYGSVAIDLIGMCFGAGLVCFGRRVAWSVAGVLKVWFV
jgi:hypothetical protein